MLSTWLISLGLLAITSALDNGLALTPPMGWLSWERYRCITDCVTFPDECIRHVFHGWCDRIFSMNHTSHKTHVHASENLFRRVAELMVSEGYLDLGYEYVIIDDCWQSRERDSEGRLQPDPDRFPNGIKALADYIHSLGLKFGIYEDYGTLTCGGYPGILGHLETDAETFAEWEADYIKLDGCYAQPADMDAGYSEFGSYLNKTGRPMVYSCSWPVYQEIAGMEVDFEMLKKTCNLWRNYNDISDSYGDVKTIMNYFADKQDKIAQEAGPGHWNDPDMLIIGNYGLSYDQSKTQMAIWAILAAPLLMSTELRDVKPEYKAILQNKAVIAVNQDELGIQGKRVFQQNNIEIWTRPISPKVGEEYSYAVAIVNTGTDGYPKPVSAALEDIWLTSPNGYVFEDLYDTKASLQTLNPGSTLYVRVNPTGVAFYRATPIATSN